MDSKLIVILAIIAVAGCGAGAFFVINHSDPSSNYADDYNYGLGYEMKSTANWTDEGDTSHTGTFTFTTRESSSDKLTVEVKYDENSTHLKTNITVTKGTKDGQPYYTASFGHFDPIEGGYSNEKSAWLAVTDKIISTDKNENMLNRMYEIAVTAFTSFASGEFKVSPDELFGEFDDSYKSTVIQYVVRLIKCVAGFEQLNDIKDENGKLFKCNILSSEGVIRSDDRTILSGLHEYRALEVVNTKIAGKTMECLDYHTYSEAEGTDIHTYYTIDGTMLIHSCVKDLTGTVLKTTYSIDSITYP